MNDCVFCKILAGDIPAHFVYNDGHVVAFLSLEQPNPYEVLALPRDNVEMVYDLNDELTGAIFRATVKIARSVRDGSKCEGMNFVRSNGEVGQQDVFHFHLHIVPRFSGDSIVLHWDNTPASQAELTKIAQGKRSI